MPDTARAAQPHPLRTAWRRRALSCAACGFLAVNPAAAQHNASVFAAPPTVAASEVAPLADHVTTGHVIAHDSAPSLMEHLHAALASHPALQAADHAITAARAAADVERAALLPSLGLEWSAVEHDQRSTGIVAPTQQPFSAQLRGPRQHIGVAATVPLLRPVQRAAWARAQLGETATQAQREAQRQTLMADVSRAYLDWLGDWHAERSTAAELAAARAQHARARAQFEAGAATVIDSREAAARADALAAQLIAAQSQRRARALTLSSLSGLPIVEAAAPSTFHGPFEADWFKSPFAARSAPGADCASSSSPSCGDHSSLVELPSEIPSHIPAHWDAPSAQDWAAHAEDHPQLAHIRAQLAQAQHAIDQARAAHAPEASLQARWARQSTPRGTLDAPALRHGSQAQVGITVTVPIFAGFAAQSAQARALAEHERAAALLADAQRRIQLAVAQAHLHTQTAAALVAASDSARSTAELALAASERAHELGARHTAELLAARAAYFQTLREWQRARLQRLAAHIGLRQAAGTLSAQDVAELASLLPAPPTFLLPTPSLQKQ